MQYLQFKSIIALLLFTLPLLGFSSTNGDCIADHQSYQFNIRNTNYTLRYTLSVSDKAPYHPGSKTRPRDGRPAPHNSRFAHDFRLKIDGLVGNTTYKGFEIGNLLLEDTKVKLYFDLKDINNQTISSEMFQHTIQHPREHIAWHYSYDRQPATNNCPIAIKNVTFDFAAQGSKLDRQFRLIDDYVTSLQQVNQYLEALDRMANNGHYHNQVKDNLRLFSDIEKDLNKLRNKNFQELNLDRNSQTDYYARVQRLSNSYDRLSEELPFRLYEEGKAYRASNPQKAREYFELAVKYQPDYRDAWLEIANLEHNRGNIKEYMNVLKQLHQLRESQMPYLIDRAYQWYFAKADLHLSRPGEVDLALRTYDEVERLMCCYNFVSNCSVPVNQQREKAFALISAAQTDAYLQLLSDAVRQAERERYDRAIKLLYEAMDFQRANQQFIPNNEPAVAAAQDIYCMRVDKASYQLRNGRLHHAEEGLFEALNIEKEIGRTVGGYLNMQCRTNIDDTFADLFNNYLEQGNQFLNRSQFNEAKKAYNAANILIKKGVVRNAPDMTYYYSQIAQQKYAWLMDRGEQAYRNNRLNEALTNYEEAANICENNQNTSCNDALAKGLLNSYMKLGQSNERSGQYSSALDRYNKALAVIQRFPPKNEGDLRAQINTARQNTAKILIGNKLAAAETAVKQNRLDAANRLQLEANQLQNQFGLQNDANFAAQQTQLSQDISTQECNNHRRQFTGQLKEAELLMGQKKYLAAATLLQHSIQEYQRFSACLQNLGAAKDQLVAIQPAADYQHLMNEFNTFVKKGRFEPALDTYERASQLYHNQQMAQQFQLTHSDLYDLIQQSSNGYFKVFGAVFYRADQLDRTKYLMRMLANSINAEIYFEELGVQLATIDVKANSYKDKKTAIQIYQMEGYKVYNKFKKAYFKQWRRMN